MSSFTENPPSLHRLPQVKARTGYSRATIYNLMAQGKFPRAVALGPRAVAWLDSEVTAWINERVSASRGGASTTAEPADALKQNFKRGPASVEVRQ